MKIPRRFEDPLWPGHLGERAVVAVAAFSGGLCGWLSSVAARTVFDTSWLAVFPFTMTLFLIVLVVVLRARFRRRRQAMLTAINAGSACSPQCACRADR